MNETKSKNLNRTKSLELFNKTNRSNLVEPEDDLNDLKSMKISDIYKNLYSVNAGKTILNLKLRRSQLLELQNNRIKMDKSSLNKYFSF